MRKVLLLAAILVVAAIGVLFLPLSLTGQAMVAVPGAQDARPSDPFQNHAHDAQDHSHGSGASDGHSHMTGHAMVDAGIDVSVDHGDLVAGVPSRITFGFTKSGSPVTDLMVHHARKVHVVIIGEDMKTIGHVHPSDFDSEREIEFTFPRAGEYLIAVDAMSSDGMISEQFQVSVSGDDSLPSQEEDLSRELVFAGMYEQGHDRYVDPVVVEPVEDGYVVTLDAEQLIAGQEVMLSYHVEREGPVEDLVPYLDAPMHFAIVRNDFGEFLHEHGVASGVRGVPDTFGPNLELSVTFPTAGTYHVFGQFKHKDQIVVSKFVVEVGE